MTSVDPRDQRIAELEALLKAALTRIAELEAMLGLNSTNSSKPPSSDPPSAPKRPKKGTGRKRGGQRGHKRNKRDLLPPEKVTRTTEVIPDECGGCGRHLRGRDPEPLRHQVIDMPPMEPEVDEYRLHALTCDDCGMTTRAGLPTGVPIGNFGPRLMALVAMCTSKYRMSKRTVQDLLADVLGVKIALGSIPKIELRVSDAVARPVHEARQYVQDQETVHMDETGWREGKSKAWLWVAVTSLVTVFRVTRSRGKGVAQQMLKCFVGVLVTDRYGAYAWYDSLMRQLCWSHLLRDFQGFVDRGGGGAKSGQSLLDQADLMFQWWHRVRDGTLSRKTFQRYMRGVEDEVGRLLRQASRCRNKKTRGMAAAMLELEESLWTFVYIEGVEPTNNTAELQVRHGVMWRKTSYGTQSRCGSRYVEHMLTVVATLKQQGRNVLEYLTAACAANLHGRPAPSLLPSTSQRHAAP